MIKKSKQKIAFILIVFALSLCGSLSYGQSVQAAGDCSEKASYSDACMEKNRSKTPLSPSSFSTAVRACEGRDSGGALSGASFNSQSGNCSNAVASCYALVADKRVCTNDTYLAYGADTSDNADLKGSDWDLIIDNANAFTGGEDLMTNSGYYDQTKKAYQDDITGKNICDARGTAKGADDCKKALNDAFEQCYSDQGGNHANVDQTKLNTCLQKKRADIAQNKTECEAAGGTWNQTTGPITGKRCTPAAAPVAPPKTCADGSTPDANGKCADGSTATTPPPGSTASKPGDAGTCGDAKTNLITCSGSGVGALGDVLKIVLFVLTLIVGIVATGGIVYGAVLYASAQDNAGQVSQAKTIIRDVVIGLILYGFMVAIVNWLSPGEVIT